MCAAYKYMDHVEICTGYTEEEKPNQAGRDNFESCGISFFNRNKQQLDSDGYCIMDG